MQQGITQSDESVTGALIVISTITLLSVGVSWLSFRSARLRKITAGEPIILVDDGNVIEPNLRRERLVRADPTTIAHAQKLLDDYAAMWTSRVDRLDALLTEGD